MHLGVNRNLSRIASRRLGAAAPVELAVLGYSQMNTTSSVQTLQATVAPPADADAVLVVDTARANGNAVTYSGSCTVGGAPATKIAGNEGSATTDFNGFNMAFLHRAGFTAGVGVSVSVDRGATSRPGGWVAIWLRNTRAATAPGGVTNTRRTTSASTISDTVQPVSTDSLVFAVGSSFVSGTPTLTSFTPSGWTSLVDNLQTGSTTGQRVIRYVKPADLSLLSVSCGWDIAGTSRGLLLVEIVR